MRQLTDEQRRLRSQRATQWNKDNPEKARANQLRWREKNRDKELLRQRARQAPAREAVHASKRGNPCVHCGLSFHPVAMDWHHRDPSEKEYNVGSMISRCMSPDQILVEIAKCDLWCSNCHRLKTHAPEELNMT